MEKAFPDANHRTLGRTADYCKDQKEEVQFVVKCSRVADDLMDLMCETTSAYLLAGNPVLIFGCDLE